MSRVMLHVISHDMSHFILHVMPYHVTYHVTYHAMLYVMSCHISYIATFHVMPYITCHVICDMSCHILHAMSHITCQHWIEWTVLLLFPPQMCGPCIVMHYSSCSSTWTANLFDKAACVFVIISDLCSISALTVNLINVNFWQRVTTLQNWFAKLIGINC